METLLRDLRYGAKMLAKSPVANVAALLCLGLGIGAATVVASLVDGVLLRPLPYESPEELFVIWQRFPGEDIERSPSSGKEYVDLEEQLSSFEGFGGMILWLFNLTDLDPPLRVAGGRLSAAGFRTLGADPLMGRLYTAEEQENGDPVVVISHGLWQRAFGGDPNVLGRTLAISEQPHEVIGVMPSRFRPFSAEVDLWVPLVPNPRIARDMRAVIVFGRLGPAVTRERAERDLDALGERFAQDHPQLYPEGWGFYLEPLHEVEVGGVRGRLLAFFGAVGLVLLIACGNVANLLLAQAASREKEVALRTALGAGRRVLLRQFLTESLMLSVLGGALGLVLSELGIRWVVRVQAGVIPRLEEVGLDPRVLAFTLAVSILTGVAFGLVPALRSSSVELQPALKEGTKTSAAPGRHPLRDALVVAEVALALVVLVGAGLMVRSFVHLQRIDPGFRTDGVVTAQFYLPRPAYGAWPPRVAFYDRLRERLRTLPGIEKAGFVSDLPFTGPGLVGNVLVEGQDPNRPGPEVGWRTTDPDYFQILGIPLLQGRTFTDRDREESALVAIVDAAMARRLWGNADPIGRRLRLTGTRHDQWREVVGVVGQVRHHGLTDTSEQLYLPYPQYASPKLSLAMRTSLEPAGVAAAVREATRAIDPTLPVADIRPLEAWVEGSVSGARFNMVLFAIFGGTGLVLALVGVYGVMSFSVSERTGEIGLRSALGARRVDLLRLILAQGMKLAGAGLVAGLVVAAALAFALSRLMSGMVVGVATTDAVTFVVVAFFLTALALVACWLPARRASRIDPLAALREE